MLLSVKQYVTLLLVLILIATSAQALYFKTLSETEFYEEEKFGAFPGSIEETIDLASDQAGDYEINIFASHYRESSSIEIKVSGYDTDMPGNKYWADIPKPLWVEKLPAPLLNEDQHYPECLPETVLPAMVLSITNNGHGLLDTGSNYAIPIGRSMITDSKLRSFLSRLPFCKRVIHIRPDHKKAVELIFSITRYFLRESLYRIQSSPLWLHPANASQQLMTLYTGFSQNARILFQVLLSDEGFIRAFCLNIDHNLISFW